MNVVLLLLLLLVDVCFRLAGHEVEGLVMGSDGMELDGKRRESLFDFCIF